MRAAMDAINQYVDDVVCHAIGIGVNVLIQGETGSGKDYLLRRIIGGAGVSEKDITTINVAEITETILESELFGHEKGAFTGASKAKRGLLESAKLIVLDEINSLSINEQAKLLRVIESGKFRRVGGIEEREIKSVFICLSNEDLDKLSMAGKFRKDLLYRIAGIRIVVPPLRKRREEILPIFYEAAGTEDLSVSARIWLRRYVWPGNIRQLLNTANRIKVSEVAYGHKKVTVSALLNADAGVGVSFLKIIRMILGATW